MKLVCPICLRYVGTCDRCSGPIVTSRWAGVSSARGHEHYHPHCLTPDELRALDEATGGLLRR